MDIRSKPRINICCPKCHHEYFFNGDKLNQQKNELKEEMSVITARINAYKSEHFSVKQDPYYKSLLRRKAEINVQYSKAKNDVANACNIAELELFIIFKKRLMEIYGKDEIVKILKECEEDMLGNSNETRIQRYSNFQNV